MCEKNVGRRKNVLKNKFKMTKNKFNTIFFLSERLSHVRATNKLILAIEYVCVYKNTMCWTKVEIGNRVICRCTVLLIVRLVQQQPSNPNQHGMSVEKALKMSLRFIRNDSYYHRFDTRLNACSTDRQMKSREKRIHSLYRMRMWRVREERKLNNGKFKHRMK